MNNLKSVNRVVNGRLYDTKTATLIAMYQNHDDDTSYDYFCDTLYQKKNAEYFVKHSFYTDGRKIISQIIPCNVEEAKKWAEMYLSGDEYMQIFGTVEE